MVEKEWYSTCCTAPPLQTQHSGSAKMPGVFADVTSGVQPGVPSGHHIK